MRRKLLYGFAGTVLIPTLGITGATFYFYPQLRGNSHQFKLAISRVANVAKSGLSMASIYLFQYNLNLTQKHVKASQILKETFMKNAGLYIKFGQVIASLDVIVPDPYRHTFESMCIQNNVTPFEEIEKLIVNSTGKQLHELFRHFEKTPISSASIAQVHYAVLHDGREVAVKVQHPWLREQCEGDISLLEKCIDLGELIFPNFKYRWLGEELRLNIPKELNFPLEVYNLKRCKYMLKNLENVKIPEVYEDFSNESMIVMEYIHGIPLLNLHQLKNEKYNLEQMAHTISLIFSRLIFKYGYVHSDPHQVEQHSYQKIDLRGIQCCENKMEKSRQYCWTTDCILNQMMNCGITTLCSGSRFQIRMNRGWRKQRLRWEQKRIISCFCQ